jgi:ring-1,2-phenylacetyl-CoA epoxidase subunit PaaC
VSTALGEIDAASPLPAPDASRAEHVLRLGDTSLILMQQLSMWIGHSPALEEDLGLANVALDLLGQARLLLSHASSLDGSGRSEDELAFLRDPADFRNLTLVEQPNGDFAQTILRQFLFDVYQEELFGELQRSADPGLAAIARKTLKEVRYHVRYSSGWVIRLGDGTAESHRRLALALASFWPYTAEFFDVDVLDEAMARRGFAPHLVDLEPRWRARVGDVLQEATLELPSPAKYRWYGKRGQHGEGLSRLLAEMQCLPRMYPGTQW